MRQIYDAGEFLTYHKRSVFYENTISYLLFELRFNFFITLNFNLRHSDRGNMYSKYDTRQQNYQTLKNLDSLARKFHAYVDRKLFGSKFNEIRNTEATYRSRMYGFIENPQTNLHIHLFADVCEEKVSKFKEAVEHAIKKIKRAATCWVEQIKSLKTQVIKAKYAMKDYMLAENFQHTFIY